MGKIENRASQLLERMTWSEKIGQMVQYGRCEDREIDLIREGKVGSLLNVHGAEKINELQRIAVEESRLGIPLLIGDDVIHGFRTIFPIPLGEAASWDLDMMEKNARIAAIEAASEGIRWTFAPMVDVTRDPRWGRIAEGTGEDTYYASLTAAAKVRGFQSPNENGYPMTAACVKHFAGYGWIEGGRDYDTTDMSERVLRETILPPFQSGIEAGALSVMSAFTELSGVPASGSRFLLRDILKGEWSFDGVVVSDWESIEEMIYHGYAEDRADSAYKGLLAGVDIDMHSGVYLEHLEHIIQKQPSLQKLLDDAVLRVLKMKFELGLFEYPYIDSNKREQILFNREHLEQARDSARQSIVLLKNEGAVLPLQPAALNKISLIGPLADDPHHSMGCWAWKGREEDVVTIRQAFISRISPSAEVTYVKGSGVKEEIAGGIEEAVRAARESDMGVVVVGESEDMTGEHYNRAHIELPEPQLKLLQAIKNETNTPLVVIVMSGRPLALEWVHTHADAVLEAWHLGTETGNAVVDVLTGAYNPSGKLPVTFPRTAGQIPIYYNRKNTGRPHLYEDYVDVDDTPLYPFGYGLSYTTFEYSDLQLSAEHMMVDGSIEVTARIKNSGPMDGAETVQLYIRDLVGSVTRPIKELRGFQKLFLQSGETKKVRFTLTPSHLAMRDERLQLAVEPGEFHVWVGPDSERGLQGRFRVV
ncbi:glycoside hydrolase family 3 N-terminal domain-containing protein [Marinicrinis lubricantis]|uniref:beta-glucosidase n=1 Tax=Marinicrinis lubricantis TaxID=2086470 RepID=A0ABW1ISW7_9BACL